ncbi:MAG: hypothetical protein L3K01_03445 [Thermoplasmata archaeon]|nr:hypothetical protein [Thermoplasmata archaeon]
MERNPPSYRWAALASVVLIAVMLAPAVGNATAASSPSASTTWAYGGDRWVNVSAINTNGTAAYTARAFIGVQVVLTQTNTSATTFRLTADRTMAGDVFVTYCHPSCANAIDTASLSFRAWEVANASANFTTAGTVDGPNGPVAALALLDSSVRTTANVTEFGTLNHSAPLRVYSASRSLTVNAVAHADLRFSPALGILPANLSATPRWTASSAFTGSGQGSVAFQYTNNSFLGVSTSGHGRTNVSVNATGTVTVQGTVLGALALQGGLPTTAIRLVASGPFSVREGFILLPNGADLFDGSGSWLRQSIGMQSASTDAVDYGSSNSPHSAIDASATAYAGSSQDPNSASPVALASPADATGSTTLQAQPETAADAGSQASCYIASSCIPGNGPSPVRAGLGGAIILTVAVVGLTVVVVGLVVARQPPRKDPPSPLANLYPTGAGATPRPPGRPSAPVPPAAEDPLGHLW